MTLTPDVNTPPLELNPYGYVANNPLRWTDPMAEGIEWGGVAVLVGGACFTGYCAVQAKKICESQYPRTVSDPGVDRKRASCAAEHLKFCVTFGMYVMDPIGETAKTAGEKTCSSCEH